MKSLRETAILLLVAVVPAALAVVLHPQLENRARAGLEPDAVTLTEVRGWAGEVLWVDARTEAEFAADSMPGAVHFAPDRFDEHFATVLGAWKPGMRIVVYCSSLSCGTSKDIAALLRDAGLDEVYHLHGGWEAWIAAAQ